DRLHGGGHHDGDALQEPQEARQEPQDNHPQGQERDHHGGRDAGSERQLGAVRPGDLHEEGLAGGGRSVVLWGGMAGFVTMTMRTSPARSTAAPADTDYVGGRVTS